MKFRALGNTGISVSGISMGCWAIGGSWGAVSDEESRRALRAAVDHGINFFDTADVYGDGRSERLVGELIRESSESLFVATKAGRRLSPHEAAGYNRESLTAFVERSLKNLGMGCVDLLQLHCPPPEIYSRPEVFGVLSELQKAGKIRHYGVSVERVEEALQAIEMEGVRSVQIIFNLFRQRPAEELFARCKERGIGILARVPLASGLLTGKLTRDSVFAQDDHRHFNRHGEVFDVGETFAGVPYEVGLDAVDRLRALVPDDASLANWALRWILMHDAVSCAIPGAKTPEQVAQNACSMDLPPLSRETMAEARRLYDEVIHPHVHERW